MIAGKEVKKRKPKARKQSAKLPEGHDPLEELGFGIVAYDDMMWTFIWLFLFFTLLMAPAIYFNADGKGY